MAQLTVVPTPIGNLKDITLRALDVLSEADLILAEDTRTSSVLLKHYNIHKPLESHHKFNEFKTAERLAQRIAHENLHVALVSDAGTPAISDPGNMLVQACIHEMVPVHCLPGPTAFVPALVVSGLSTEAFTFVGFLPVKKGRQTLLRELSLIQHTVVIYESPFRVVKTLTELAQHCGEARKAATVREISKIYETCNRGTLSELIAFFDAHPPKGEFVILLEGAPTAKELKRARQKEDNANSLTTKID